MSREAAFAFLREVSENASTEQELQRAIQAVGGGSVAIAAMVGFGAGRGHGFAAGDLEGVLKDQAGLKATTGELSADELRRVSGGFNPQPEPPGLPIPEWLVHVVLIH